MTPLDREIRQRIVMEGPMPLAEYMSLCLTHPQHGYYTTGHPFGGRASPHRAGGDFVTAPEVSQMFGELIGVWCMEMWQALDKPTVVSLVELGPGRGTLMQDLLRVIPAAPRFQEAIRVHLVEISPTLGEQQSLALSTSGPTVWHRDIDDLPDIPTLIIANEFLDALPFRQWCKTKNGWYERAVGLDDKDLAYVIRPNRLAPDQLPKGHEMQPEGTLFETAPAREAFVSRVADRLKKTTGAALFIDYGHDRSGFGDTFQAVRGHQFADPLSCAGRADLTSHVDFEPLLAAVREAGCTAPHPVTQGDFLLSLGLLERAGSLGKDKPKSVQNALSQAVERLAAPDQMGELFKVMVFGAAITPGNRWPGFPTSN